MLPRNFPERKNQRRQNALTNFVKSKPRKQEKNESDKQYHKYLERRQEEIKLLETTVVFSARNVRTKIRRGDVVRGRR
jgi:hypothetical protein